MPSNQIPQPPAFKYLKGRTSHLEQLRSAVAPILSNRVLTNFTDHSVTHSDSITELIDALIEPLQASKHALSEQELTILYASCYLHDIGMHYENAGETTTIRNLNLKTSWAELLENERRNLLRKYHHLISAEMIIASVRAENPIIGLQMTDQYKPDLIASLSEAQNLSIESERYRELTTDVAGIRMRLLSGLLRLADILEESHRRASPQQARTLQLDLTSQTHWWRHYYTSNVTVDQTHRLVTVWFDFPTDRRAEYSNVVPQLQMPWIENEFNYHAPVFHQYGFGWSVTHAIQNTAYSSVATMPDSVLSEMWKQVLRQRKSEDDERKYESLQHFRRSMPSFDRRISEIEKKRETMSAEEHLKEISAISNDLWEMGAKRSASELLVSAYKDEILNSLPSAERINIGIQLASMFSEQGDPRRAIGVLQGLQQIAVEISDNQDTQFVFWKIFAKTLVALCDYKGAIEAFQQAIELAPHDEKRNELEAQVAELQLLYGELESLASTS